MTLFDSESRKWLDDNLEAFLDGDLSAQDAVRFRSMSSGIREVQDQMRLSELISTSLKSIPDETCPEYVAKSVMAHVRRDIRRSTWSKIESFFLGIKVSQLKPVFAVAVLLLVVISSTQLGKPGIQTDAEISQALNDVKWTLAYLSGVGKTTGTTVRSNVIEDQVVGPMSRSLNILMEN